MPTCNIQDPVKCHHFATDITHQSQQHHSSGTKMQLKQHIWHNPPTDDQQNGNGQSQEAKKRKRDISTAWSDYKKIYDSVPHDWIFESLTMHKFDPTIINLLYKINYEELENFIVSHSTQSSNIDRRVFNQHRNISRWLYIWSSLHLVFTTTLMVIKENTINLNVISHLLSMEELKLYAANEIHLNAMVNIVKKFSDDIRMAFGFDKCNTLTVKRGKII